MSTGENSAQGNGITKHSMEQLFSAGADIITTGNHCFQRREALSIYEKETVLRPLNFPDSCPGHGCTIWDNGPYQVAVINLMGTAYMDPLDNPFTVIEEFLPTLPTKNIIVDFHAEATAEKKAMGHFLTGKVSAGHRHAHPCTDRRRSHLEPPHRLFNRCCMTGGNIPFLVLPSSLPSTASASALHSGSPKPLPPVLEMEFCSN